MLNQLVAKLYDQGKMGTPARFKARYFADVPRAAYLQSNGRLKRFQDLKDGALTDAQKMINGHLLVSPFPYAGQAEATMAKARRRVSC